MDVSDRFANEHILETGQAHHVAGVGFINLNALEAFKVANRRDFRSAPAAVAVDAGGGIAHFDFASVDLAEGDTSEVIRVIEIGDENLEPNAGMGARRRN